VGIFLKKEWCRSRMNIQNNIIRKLRASISSLFVGPSVSLGRSVYNIHNRVEQQQVEHQAELISETRAQYKSVSPIRRYALMVVLGVVCLWQTPLAHAQGSFLVTFDEYPLADATNTTVIDSEYQTGGADNTSSPLPVGGGFSLTITGGGNVTGDATVYNSNTGTNGNDPDLEFSNTGNVLISQETGNTNPDGSFIPDDASNSDIEILFESPLSGFGFSLIDFEPGTDIIFTDSNGNTAVVNAAEVIDPTSPFFQGPACELGDNNFCIGTSPYLPSDLGIIDILQVEIDFQLSGGIDLFVIEYETGAWSGNVSEDIDNNGTGDVPIPNVEITLFRDIDGDGIISPDEIALQPDAPTTLTDVNGDYEFTDVIVGDYVAVQTQPSGFDDVSEDEGGADNDDSNNPADNNQIAGTVSSGETDISNDFVEELIPGNISGNVSEDTTGDGSGDTPIEGVVLTLFTDPNGDGDPSDGVAIGTATTDSSGDYVFTDVPQGDFVVFEKQPAGLGSVSEVEGGADGDQPDNALLNFIAVTVDASDPDAVLTNEDVGNNFVESNDFGICFGTTESDQDLLLINNETGETEIVGPTGVPNIEAIAFAPDPVSGEVVLFAADMGDFGVIDTTTGAFTLIGPFGAPFDDVDG